MRRLLILGLLFGGTLLILPLGTDGQGSRTLLTFGFLILAAYTVGELVAGMGLPKIVGYLFAGMAFGPSALDTVTNAGIERLGAISDLAIALIAFLAGAELRWGEIRERGGALLRVLTAELLVTFIALASAVWLLRDALPFLRDAPPATVAAAALLFASIAIVHSPAVTIALLTETGARGPVAKTTLGVVLLADIAVVLLFTGALALARAIAPAGGGAAPPSLGLVTWEIVGALVVGAALGLAVAAYLRFVGRELMLFAVLVAFFGLEIARVAHVELLLTLLTAGFVTENLSSRGDELRHALERSAAPIFVIFFALSGAKIDLGDVLPLLPLVVPIAAVRAGAIWAGTRIGGRWGGITPAERNLVWMGLVSQAGVAIGLAAIVADAYGAIGEQLRNLLLALVAVNETIGPILFRRALTVSGEAGGDLAPAPVAEDRGGAPGRDRVRGPG
ncbi:MAG TPA: cation:proton antiporter [Longimicrobiales bacterium]|nr:cation:proton antiporter [Longimicrobiales bacterium]